MKRILALPILACLLVGCSAMSYTTPAGTVVEYETAFQNDNWKVIFFETGAIRSIEFDRNSDPAAAFFKAMIEAAVDAAAKGGAP